MIKNIGFVSLGCPKNLVDSEHMIGILKNHKFKIVDDFNLADVLIVNTCGFIDSAKQESIDTILELAEYKSQNCKKLIVTGCLAERFKEEIIKEIPEVDVVLGVGNISRILDALDKDNKILISDDRKKAYFEDISRYVDKSKTFSYLKIADGCNNCCSYCVIPSIRGPYQSRQFERIIDEAVSLAKTGIYELILIAQDLTKYGLDLYGKKKLTNLIKGISKIGEIKRIRLLYCYPDEIDDDLINEFIENEKLVKYIDIPIQHINDIILKSMNRKSGKKEIENILHKIRNKIPDIIIRTSIITGFPGETLEQHIEMCKFIKDFRFDRLGVFKYSEEEGTKAFEFIDKIDEYEKEKRYNELMEIQNAISKELMKIKINTRLECVVEGVADDGIFYYGRSYGDTPEIDGLIYFTSVRELRFNEYVKVKILDSCDYDLIGEVENEFTK